MPSREYSVAATPEQSSEAERLTVTSVVYHPFKPFGVDGLRTVEVVGAVVSACKSAVVTVPAETLATHQ